MNFKMNWLLLCTFVLLGASGCYFDIDDDDDGIFNCVRGEGDVETITIDMPAFKGIEIKNSIDVVILQGDQQRVEVQGQQNIIDRLELDVRNDIWEIEFEGCVRNANNFKVFITLPDIEFLAISGSGEIFGDNTIETDELELRISGSGEIDLAVVADFIDTRISGSGNVKLEGRSEEFNLKISASGDYEAFGLETERGDIKISGSGDAEVFVNEYLNINITGSGDVHYIGYPLLDIRVTGSGDIFNEN